MKKNGIKTQFTFFHKSLVSLVEIYNQQNQPTVDISSLTEDKLEEIIVAIDEVELTYDFSTSKVIKLNL